MSHEFRIVKEFQDMKAEIERLISEVSTFRMAIETAMDLYTEDYDDATTARLMYDALGMVLVSEGLATDD